MSWNHSVANGRIDGLIANSPKIVTQTLDDRVAVLRDSGRFFDRSAVRGNQALVSIPRDRAVIVNGAHVYANLLNLDDYRLEDGRETEESFKRSLAFLDLYYAATDYLLEEFGAVRVDFHFGRMHCIVVEPANNEAQIALRAVELAQRLREFSGFVNEQIARSRYLPKIRVGVDIGTCVAINNGIGLEQEPLFLGPAANYAAKLAEGDEEGVYLSTRVRNILRLPSSDDDERVVMDRELSRQLIVESSSRGFGLLDAIPDESEQFSRLQQKCVSDVSGRLRVKGNRSSFRFHVHAPPLKSINYSDLSPSNSILMPVASIFADIDGYTDYIDRCRAKGAVPDAVKALHVIRGEFNNVLKQDFQSRKVRYVGDCIHGLLAFGTGLNVDPRETARQAVSCAAALRASFKLIQKKLGTIDDLGLAVGIDFGDTPITRVGIRGERSVRAAPSSATIGSEILQKQCDGNSMAVGDSISENLPAVVTNMFNNNILVQRYGEESVYDMIQIALRGAPSIVSLNHEFRPHCA